MDDVLGDAVAAIALIATVGIVIWGITIGVLNASTQSACLKAGYPSARLDWKMTRYCIKRIDQTDVVVPLERVR